MEDQHSEYGGPAPDSKNSVPLYGAIAIIAMLLVAIAVVAFNVLYQQPDQAVMEDQQSGSPLEVSPVSPTEEADMTDILERLTAPAADEQDVSESQVSPKIIKSLTAPQTESETVPDEVLKSLTAPSS